MRVILLIIIKVYQKTLSFDHGVLGRLFPGFRPCIYVPTCSEYAYEAINRYGAIKGAVMSGKRITRCVPWNKPCHDPVPVKNL